MEFKKQLSFFGKKATVFLVLLLPAPFIVTPSVMAKSADDIACLTFPISIIPPLQTPSVITLRTSACSMQRELALLARASWKQGHSKQSVITSMIIIAASNITIIII